MIELKRLDEFVKIRREAIPFPAMDFEELENEIKFLQIKDSVLSEESFSRLHRASNLSNEILKCFEGFELAFPELQTLLDNVESTDEITKAVDKVFNAKWIVRDDASPELMGIRNAIGSVRRQIAKNFAKVLKEFQGKGFLGDTGEAYLNERRVLAIYSTHKRKIPGVVAGSSKTGSLTYIEPEINIHLNFEVESLMDDERQEIRRILLQLTNSIFAKFLCLIL
jgi:DNA mismatch repair protein MutS2